MTSTLVTCMAVRQSAGVVSVGVSNVGETVKAGTLSYQFGLERTVVSMTPSAGPVDGGESILLTLEGTWDTSETIPVRFGRAVARAQLVNSTHAAVVAPSAAAPGLVALESEDYVVQGSVEYQYYESPAVLALWPTRGPVAGGTRVSVKGSNLIKTAIQCRFGPGLSSGVQARWVSSSLAECTSPAQQDNGLVTVEVSFNDGATFTRSQVRFMYDMNIALQALRPSRGTAETSGQAVTVIGQHFQQGSELSCHFGLNQTVLGLLLSSSLVVCSVPARGHGVVSVGVSNSGVEDVQAMTLRYEYGVMRSVTDIIPSRGPVSGGCTVSVTGLGLDSESGQYACLYGMNSVVGQLVRPNLVLCRSPTGIMAGSVVDLMLTVDKELVSGVYKFEVYDEPRVVSLMPSRGTVQGGSYVSVLGSKFSGSEVQCRFGSQGVSGSGVRLLSSTLIACRVPPGTLGESVAVEISLNGGLDFSTEGREFLYGRAVTVELARPSQAIAGVTGQTVTVVGRHFEQTRELSCRFGLSADLGARESQGLVCGCCRRRSLHAGCRQARWGRVSRLRSVLTVDLTLAPRAASFCMDVL